MKAIPNILYHFKCTLSGSIPAVFVPFRGTLAGEIDPPLPSIKEPWICKGVHCLVREKMTSLDSIIDTLNLNNLCGERNNLHWCYIV